MPFLPLDLALPGQRRLRLSRPAVMAIVNCTPDSFWEGSRAFGQAALEAALCAEAEGADIIDFGAESTRPGSQTVPVDEELERLIPAIEAFRARSSLPVSVDTRKALVAEAAIAAGADIVNDVSGLSHDPAIGPLCARTGAALVLMHMKGEPETMQKGPFYASVVDEVRESLEGAVKRALECGIPPDALILDPGFGFGKRLEDNLDLLSQLAQSVPSGYPVLVGMSRKSMIGALCQREVPDRLAGTIAAHTLALSHGAQILRVHDVVEAVDSVAIWMAVEGRTK